MYFYATQSSATLIESSKPLFLLFGSDFGYGNFGDIVQHKGAIRFAKSRIDASVISFFSVNAISGLEFIQNSQSDYGFDGCVFVSEFPVVLEGHLDGLRRICDFQNVIGAQLYGGGFLNSEWGPFVLGVVEAVLGSNSQIPYVISGQQVSKDFIPTVVTHVKRFGPALVGARDEDSLCFLRAAGLEVWFSFDDAVEELERFSRAVLLEPGPGLGLHLNTSDYASSPDSLHETQKELELIERRARVCQELTLFQAFTDRRLNVVDTSETMKRLDDLFPFADSRLISLALLARRHSYSPLQRPISISLACSSSYHVALWLQLQGIPCWLATRNDFCDQKARALQVNQSLADFLESPQLADHSVNLDRRSRWLEELESWLASLGAGRLIRAKVPKSQMPPWPAAPKGLDADPIFDRESSSVGIEAQDRWYSLEMDPGNLQTQTLSHALAEIGLELHRERVRSAEASQGERERYHEVLAILHSTSWKLTRPLRFLSKHLRKAP